MTIEAKELITPPHFEGLATFSFARAGTETRKPSWVFESYGGQIAVDVDETECANPPAEGALYQVIGVARRNNWNGTMSLFATSKRLVSPVVSSEHMEEYVSGLRIKGVGKVEAKNSVVVQRSTFMKATLKWQGAIHEFKSLTPEIYQRIPAAGSYCRFELNLLPGIVRNPETGQDQVIHKPGLIGIKADTLALGSVPSPAAPSQKPATAAAK